MKKIFTLSLIIFNFFIAYAQNVGIGTTTPNASAILDVQSNNKGMLVPRIALTAANTALPVTSPADALLIYNTATAGTGNNAVSPGFYYWSSVTGRWNAISSANGNNSVGFGSWGDCSMNNISDYNPIGASDGLSGDFFGQSTSISGNFAIAGAPLDSIGANAKQGSAYIFYFNGSNWVQLQKLTASDGAANDYFGYSVSISGNYAIVSAFLDDIGGNADQGSAYIFFYNGTNWVQQQKLTANDGAAGDGLGSSVSVSGNYAVAGAPGANTSQGSAYIFFYNGSSWVQQKKLTANDGAAGDQFGTSVSISGNYAIASAPFKTIGANAKQGAAYIFLRNGNNWVQQQKLIANDGQQNSFFGIVSISGNYAIVGALEDVIGSNNAQGSAYIFYYNGSNWVQQQKLVANDGNANDYFGNSVSISGNYAIAGAPKAAIGTSTDQGAAYIFQNTDGIWVRLQKVINPAGNSNDFFGQACALDSTRFVIGNLGFLNLRGTVVFGKIK